MSAHSFDDVISTALPKLQGPLADEEEGRLFADFGEKVREIKYDIVVSDLRRDNTNALIDNLHAGGGITDSLAGDLWTAASAI